jgi:hypothetical protein
MHGDIGVAGGQVMFAYRTFRHEAPWGSYRLATRGTPTVETTPPTLVAGTPFEHERDQAVVFRFDKPLMGVDAADVVVRNTTTGATIASNLFGVQVIAANTQSWTYRWVYSGGILPNGNYTATLLAGSVTDLAGNATTQDQTGNVRVLMGDADDNGRIDGADYALIDAGFNQQLSGWSNGDFNYDGKIDGMDYALIDAAFNAQSAPPVQGKPGKAGTGGLRK